MLVWGNCSDALFTQLENQHIRAARIIYKVPEKVCNHNVLMQVSISSKTIPPPGHDLRGTKTLPPGQSLCTKTLPSGQNMESKAPPSRHKVRKFQKYIIYKL